MASGFGIFSQIFTRIVSLVKSQINGISKWTLKLQSFANLTSQKIQEKITKFIQLLTSRPKSKKDYWKIFDIYFSKRFVVMSFAAFAAFLFIFVNLIYPFLDGKLWYAKVYTNTQKYSTFSGKAKVYNPTNNLIYYGEMSNGHANGYGEQYDVDGKILYKGAFNTGKYHGEGQLYNEYENVIYKGSFENNKFHGQGQQINNLNIPIFTGSFESGMKSGRGIEFDPKSGLRKFYGEYKNDLKEGKGIEYTQDGEGISYEGNFKDNKYDGDGKLYLDNHLVYLGEFKNGLYNGNGTAYDKNSGIIKYIGEFKNGLFDGQGELFNIKNMKLMFEGNFSKGKRHGEGIAFDYLGTQIYSGKFRNDGIDFISILNANEEKIRENFKEPDSHIDLNDKKIIVYSGIRSAMLMLNNSTQEEQVCDKVFVNLKDEFMGLNNKSSALDCNAILGDTYSSTLFESRDYYPKIFKILDLSFENNKCGTNKYVFDGYYVRVFFNSDYTEAKAIEIGKVS
ncbi:MAG: hypothetical protein CfP315_0875 [Candidatus Improbicoccus pseudotrichonymphae]|uniref:MORN repeat protein n=1 Tax=Candidatus Improbicoccus pseudotrichonymphae TaxID=3033792 RepID=A0AA48KXC5_9FIRM|nr:MAG: hypothetical protein CfP315_0875 [Candidatus Improbicoccus pseudotrichonymphae]